MPAYCYVCGNCQRKTTIVRPVSRCSDPVLCECGSGAVRDYHEEHASGIRFSQNWPMRSDAAGVHPDQAKEAHEHSVSIGAPTQFDSLGRAIFTSAKHRKNYCEKVGLFDKNAGYSDPQPQRRTG